MVSGPIVLKRPVATLEVAGETPGTPVDVSCWVARAEISPSTDTADLATFCNPGGQAEGVTTWEVSIDWKSSHDSVAGDDLYGVLSPLVGSDVVLTLMVSAASAKAWQGTIGLPVNPGLAGSWEPGSPIEASTTHALRSTPEIVAAPVTLETAGTEGTSSSSSTSSRSKRSTEAEAVPA